MNRLNFIRSRLFAIGVFLCATLVFTGAVASRATVVRVTDESGTRSITTLSRNLKDVIKQSGDTIGPHDEVLFTGFEKGMADLTIKHAFHVKVMADGKTETLMVTGGLVADALNKLGITVDCDDEISIPLEAELAEGMDIHIGRVEYRNVVKTVPVPYETTQRASFLLKKGSKKLASPGADGTKEVTEQQKLIDGVVVNSTVVGEKITQQPVGALMLVGAAKKNPISQIEPPEGFALDGSGKVASYKKIVTGYATAYSAKKGTKTASGSKAMVGHIAVNPNVIPYGTKLYIETTDGSCVYGCAVAADTGSFINRKDKPIVADLFFDTYAESCMWGVKKINIYVLQ